MIENFSINRRNYGHWDICANNSRLFRIRGGPGNYVVMDEREEPYPSTPFKTVGSCMLFIYEELMYELITVEGQNTHVIEDWNI